MRLRSPRWSSLLVPAVVAVLAAAAPAIEFTRDFAFDADELLLLNLIGEIRVAPAPGDRFEVRVAVQGKDADPDLIEIRLDEGRQARLEIKFPVGSRRDYVYPRLGSGSRTKIREPGDEKGDRWWKILLGGFGGSGINVRGSGSGLEVWADIAVLVPRGRLAEVKLGAGAIESAGVNGDLKLDVRSGSVRAEDHRGRLVADTGSGGVNARGVDGELSIDTGSGAVAVLDHRGGSLHVDTGSGGVEIERADTERLHVDTGSGSVKAVAVRAERAHIDTGSGAVALELDRLGAGPFIVDTGSGGVRLVLPADASAMITVDTGSGGIRADLPDAEILHQGRGEMRLRVGGGDAKVKVDTGSGGVTITGR
ncbi:MAG: DUF4097 family beta strand repeat-containing protein [Candidatus Krumholzibacteria bacterium]|jgi:hypothetical protein|nr:DUF4097 family beta strand repeat-containing protein [Candidatus Krumholzibacteria bacterium]